MLRVETTRSVFFYALLTDCTKLIVTPASQEAHMDIDILGTIRALPPWHKNTLLVAAVILGGYAGWYVWLLAH